MCFNYFIFKLLKGTIIVKRLLLVIVILGVVLLIGCDKKIENEPSVTNQQNKATNSSNLQEDENSLATELPYNYITEKYNEQSGVRINRKIDDLYLELKTIAKDHNGEYVDSVDYKYSISDNILSILIERTNNIDDAKHYYTYNFDINSGNELEILDVLGEDKAGKLLQSISEYAVDRYNKVTEVGFSDELKDEVYEVATNAVPKNSTEVKYYIEDGEITIYLELLAFAGPLSHEEAVNMNDLINE